MPAYESEARDDHGKWTSGGSGGTGRVHEKGFNSSGTIGPKARGEIQQAYDDAVARHPELGDVHVEYSSATGPGEIPDDELTRVVKQWGAQAVTDAGGEGDKFSEDRRIVINDQKPLHPGLSSQLNNGYGMVTHELGHAFYAENGVTSEDSALELLKQHEIGPDIAAKATGSAYAASSAQEALGEMYGVAHTPGASFRVDGFADRYAALEASVRS